ncbi:MAG: hypothetical protein HFH47_00465 [Bacilli bacterium]|nr:hypothetical protein [Bacilli bacterium]
MFKRIKDNEKYQKFKELWANERTRSIITLGFWLIFFAVVVLFIRVTAPTPTSNDTVNNTAGTSFDKMSNYSFSASSDNVEINGFVYNDNMEFILNNKRYYSNNDVYLINGDKAVKQEFDLSFLKINAKMLNNLLGELKGTEKDNCTQYLVPLDRFINLYEIDTEADLSKAMNYNVVVNVYKNKDVIKGVTLDLTNYKLFRFNDNTPFVVTIYYYNINNISDFTKEYEKMVGGK